jgi:hypothetical protein
MNDVKIKGSKPISENLSTITVGDQTTCLEISDKNGARVTGDLEVTGALSMSSLTDLTMDDIILDDITCSTITTSGTITAGGNIDAGSNTLTANGGLIADNITIDGTEINLSSGDLSIDVDGNIRLDSGDGIYLDVADGGDIIFREGGDKFATIYDNLGSYFRLYESPGGTDNFTIFTGANGATSIGTIDAAGNEADLTFDADGSILFQTIDHSGALGIGEDITLRSGGLVVVDKNYTNTTATTTNALHIDLDRTGTVSTGTDTATGIDLDVNQTGASGGTITSYGLDIDVVGDAGVATSKAIGASINASGATIATGLEIDVDAGTASKALGIYIDCEDGGNDLKIVSSANSLDYFSIKTIEDGETTLTTAESGGGSTAHLNMVVDGQFRVDAASSILLDSGTGDFIAKNAGTEFSVANSAYAGMILGYRMIGEDAAYSSYTFTTSMAVPDSDMTVRFIAPPSGAVEVTVQFLIDGSAGRYNYVGLSDNATYNSIGATYEQSFNITDETDQNTIQHTWVVTGLTAGDTYNYWMGVSSNSTVGYVKWGGSSGGRYPDFIMKVVALPTAAAGFAVYD